MGECSHSSTREETSTVFSSGQYWDDVGKQWVAIEKKTVTTKTICNDCGTTISTSESTS